MKSHPITVRVYYHPSDLILSPPSISPRELYSRIYIYTLGVFSFSFLTWTERFGQPNQGPFFFSWFLFRVSSRLPSTKTIKKQRVRWWACCFRFVVDKHAPICLIVLPITTAITTTLTRPRPLGSPLFTLGVLFSTEIAPQKIIFLFWNKNNNIHNTPLLKGDFYIRSTQQHTYI